VRLPEVGFFIKLQKFLAEACKSTNIFLCVDLGRFANDQPTLCSLLNHKSAITLSLI
jgi:hypothetical protein